MNSFLNIISNNKKFFYFFFEFLINLFFFEFWIITYTALILAVVVSISSDNRIDYHIITNMFYTRSIELNWELFVWSVWIRCCCYNRFRDVTGSATVEECRSSWIWTHGLWNTNIKITIIKGTYKVQLAVDVRAQYGMISSIIASFDITPFNEINFKWSTGMRNK